jgi:hypothetical protein
MRHSEELWEEHKETIRRLYLDENMTIVSLIETMARQHGFRATYDMFLSFLSLLIRPLC